MSIQFFGQYLLHRGRITADQLLLAVKLQDKVNVKVGTLAIDRGYMTSGDVQRINDLQRKVDKRFGELAIEQGLITAAQLQELLASQKHDRLFLGEALVKAGALTPDELNVELEAFRKDQADTPKGITELYRGQTHAQILEAFTEICVKMFERVAHFAVRPGPCHADQTSPKRYDYSVVQRFTGRFEGMLALNLSTEALLQIAGEMLQEKVASVDEAALDAGAEFLNTVCGNICSKLSLMGHATDLRAPKAFTNRSAEPLDLAAQVANGQLVTTPLYYPGGSCELAVVITSFA